ncbi:MAG TPA: type II secretion system protein [Candidatus Paceibacterota bacterium]|nr:type II secretion system protein [Candidatus Paceibacterota bacterium]
MKGNKKTKKGFTLIELLVVIAIIAILSVVVILTLNPAELLRQSRDSNRISDLSVTKSAVAFYLASVSSNVFIGTSTSALGGILYVGDQTGPTSTAAASKYATTMCTATCATLATNVEGAGFGAVTSTNRAINGTGWIPINFTQISAGGSPISQLPADPNFNPSGAGQNTYYYAYIASSTGLVFKLDAHMESQKYGLNGSNDVVSTDGGYDNNSYEVGSAILNL